MFKQKDLPRKGQGNPPLHSNPVSMSVSAKIAGISTAVWQAHFPWLTESREGNILKTTNNNLQKLKIGGFIFG